MNLRTLLFTILLALLAACGHPSREASTSAPEVKPETPPVLHVVGVYEGALPESADKRPWWAQCAQINREAPTKIPSVTGAGETAQRGSCDAQTIRGRESRSVTVNITDDSSPIVLGLMSYEPVTWKIEASQNVTIKRIILGGYHTQRIEGVSEIQVDVYTYERTECDRCVQKGKYFYSYKGVPAEMEAAVGLKARSFQGNYTGGRYTIFREMK